MKTWNPISTLPKDGEDLIVWDGDRTITRGFYDGDTGDLIYFWFDCLDPTYDLAGQFKYWIPLPKKRKTK